MNNKIVPEFIKIDESTWINIDQITSVYCGETAFDGITLTIYLSDGRGFSFYDFDEIKSIRNLLRTFIPSIRISLMFPDESNNGGEKDENT